MILKNILQFIFLVSSSCLAILYGDRVEWNRHGFLTKILARNEGGKTKSCTGSLISASLVLTAKSCVTDSNGHDELQEFVIQVATLGKRTWFEAKLLKRSEDWALLRIHKQNITEMCPGNPAPKWVSRLNFSPSLTNPSLDSVNPSNFGDSNCFMIGFQTTDQGEDFLTQEIVIRLDLEELHDPSEDDSNYRSRVMRNYGSACFDDAGSPIFCRLIGHAGDIQVGFFQWLKMVEGQKIVMDSKEKCAEAKEMDFAITTADTELVKAIEEYGMAEFVEVYQKCEFSNAIKK